jgi:nitrogen regulatory protein PII 2
MLSLAVKKEDSGKVVKIIMQINKTSHYGDGKIFILPVRLIERIRTAEEGPYAIS